LALAYYHDKAKCEWDLIHPDSISYTVVVEPVAVATDLCTFSSRIANDLPRKAQLPGWLQNKVR